MLSPGRSVTEGALVADQPETFGVVPVVSVSGVTLGAAGATNLGFSACGADGKGWASATSLSRCRDGATAVGAASSERCTETGAEARRALELDVRVGS